ncbi:transglutaminase domain-containing protein [Rubritalea spongiae]|uniref:Transglutaminase domain-containing protein n=1 Tax=Rubritalea spongiae TaxID=430797 RepID=A0ABW5DY64_9BACT
MKVKIKHRTSYQYAGEVNFGEHVLLLRPLDNHRRHVDHFEVETVPASTQRWVRDAYGNVELVCNFGLTESRLLEFVTHIEVSLLDDNPFDFILESYATSYPFSYQEPDARALLPYMGGSGATRGALRVLDWLNYELKIPSVHENVVQFLSDLNGYVRRDIAYVRRDEEGIQTPDTTLTLRSGSCRDMAVLYISAVRKLGFAARFVSGYLFDPEVGDAGEHAFNRAVGSMHAWAEVYLPGAGWKGFDPTNGILANAYFIPSAVSHEPSAVDPIQGKYFAQQSVSSTMEVELEMEEINEVRDA